jgi:DNA-binding NarL/FixJ family response regulator
MGLFDLFNLQTNHKNMKLAEGLLLRADIQKKIEQLQNRIRPNLIVSDDNIPQEDPNKLLAQLRNSIQEFETIVIRINKTNNKTLVDGQTQLMEMLAKRDSLKLLVEKLRNVQQAAQINHAGYNRLKSTINYSNLQIEIDQTGRAFREIDSKIQEINWLTELEN